MEARIQRTVLMVIFLTITLSPVPLTVPLMWATSPDDELPRSVFQASTIPPHFLKDARAVVRHGRQTFIVKNQRKALLKIHRVVTVLNAEGRDFGELVMWYDRFTRVSDLEATLYDAAGTEIRSLSGSDVKDYSATSGSSLYDDNRVRYATLYHSTYPYTLEYMLEFSFDGYVGWPKWYPEEDRASVEYSRFDVTLPAGMPLRRVQTFAGEPSARSDGEFTTYTWEAKGLPPFEPEPVGPSIGDQRQHVTIAPEKFEMDGYAGDLTSWQSFGKWYFTLQANRQTLPSAERQAVSAMVAGLRDRKEKIRKVYEYLQKKTRYVSVPLGIGGWQPFDATYVSTRGYGDCKALTNYMLSLLGEVGIEARPALIYSSQISPQMSGDFACNVFNHVILCAPAQNDTIWLECTSQDIPFGHLSYYNESRNALVVGPEGGTLVRTPTSSSKDNRQMRSATVVLQHSGNATATIHTTYTGNQQDYVRLNIGDASSRERDEWVRENLDIGSFDIIDKDFSDLQVGSKEVGFSLRISLPRYASIAGNRLLFQPNLMGKRQYVPRPVRQRKQPIVHRYAYKNIDSVKFQIPAGYRVEAIPKPVDFETSFARYKASSSLTEEGVLVYLRELEVMSQELPPATYDEYRRFFHDVAQADKANVALVLK
jgi:transglutaminase-like putative cysteine protease